jgi:hypothetical protein
MIKKGILPVNKEVSKTVSKENIDYEEIKHIVAESRDNLSISVKPSDIEYHYLINDSIIGLINEFQDTFVIKGFLDNKIDYNSLLKIVKDNVVIKKVKLDNDIDDDCDYVDDE